MVATGCGMWWYLHMLRGLAAAVHVVAATWRSQQELHLPAVLQPQHGIQVGTEAVMLVIGAAVIVSWLRL